MKKMKNLTIRKCFMYALLSMLVIGHVSCKKDKTDENTVKVCIAFDSPDKTQKIYVDASSSIAAIYWTPNTQIRMINTTNNIRLVYTGNNKQVANFQITQGQSMPQGDYIGVYPSNSQSISFNAYNNIIYRTPDVYTIFPNDVDGYLIDNVLMYTHAKYNHGGSDTAFFKPAMTILEIPIKTDSGSYFIQDLVLHGVSNSGADKSFIKEGKLPDIIHTSTYLHINETVDSITYHFQGNGLEIDTSLKTIKLLVWSLERANVSKYHFKINDGDIVKTITRSALKNSIYYKLPTLNIAMTHSNDTISPDSIVIGSSYAGGIVFHIFKSGEPGYVAGETHGLVCAPTILSPMIWGNNVNYYCGTSTALGSGQNNTNIIVGILGEGAYAAYACDTCTQSGKTDWFLPSKDELDSLRVKLNLLPNYLPTEVDYSWSSSDNGNEHWSNAYRAELSIYGSLQADPKTTTYYVIPVRKF
ncbi:MAG: hypothetical protein PHS04_17540 [Tissierellia bacterium]|nr:hypothetical protein [Tissierellia bacterium]